MDQPPQSPPDPSILAIVRQIASTLHEAIAASRADGSLRPRMQGFVRTAFTEWEYGEKGMGQHTCETSLVAKPVWWGGPLEAVIAKVDGEIERAAALLSAIDPTWQRTGDAVVNVCEQLGLAALERTGCSDTELERLAGLLEATLRKQPVRAWIRTDLVGVAVLTTRWRSTTATAASACAPSAARTWRAIPLWNGPTSRPHGCAAARPLCWRWGATPWTDPGGSRTWSAQWPSCGCSAAAA